ncbi:hypothetical protein ACFQ60_26760 [Streptomyces zhihengii]
MDGDGLSDMIVQDANGVVQVSTGTTAHELVYDDGQGSAYQVFKDVFATGGLRADGPVHFTLSASGRLSAYANDVYTPSRYWSGGGWQIYNKVFSPGTSPATASATSSPVPSRASCTCTRDRPTAGPRSAGGSWSAAAGGSSTSSSA